MKMIRVSYAAILAAVALATNDTVAPVVAPTESPVAVAEHARDSALEHANETLHTIMRTAHESSHLADDEDLVDQEVATIETAVSNTTQHYLRQRLQLMHNRERARKQDVSVQVDAAKTAANEYKHAARVLEAVRRSAGLSERVYEGGFQHDEGQSEGWHDEAENHGDAADDHIEEFFDAVEGKIERHAEHEEREQDDDNNRGNQENDDGDNNRGNHEDQQDDDSDAAGPAPAPASDDQDDRDDSDASAPAPASDDQDDRDDSDASAPAPAPADDLALNLRAVAQNPRNPQGFLLTFACIGFLASMAFAVQMQGRRTRSPAREPLLMVHD